MSHLKLQREIDAGHGVFKYGKLNVPGSEVRLPAKTTRLKHVTDEDRPYESTWQINEVYQSVDRTSLRDAINGDGPNFLNSLRRKLKYAEEHHLNVVLIDYKESDVMSESEAREIIGIINKFSDVVTLPLQSQLLHAIVKDGKKYPVDDPFHNYKRTIENCLDVATELNSQKPIMGSLSFVREGLQNELLRTYDDFGVEIFGVDFVGKHPTGVRNEVANLIGRITSLDLFDGTVMYAYNLSKCQYRRNSDVLSPQNLAPVGSGFDIVGDNHMGLGFQPEGERKNFTVFDLDVVGYRSIPVADLVNEWPTTVVSNISPERINSFNPTKAGQLIGLVNSEQLQLCLNQLGDRIEGGYVENFIENNEGISPSIESSFSRSREAYLGGGAAGPGAYS